MGLFGPTRLNQNLSLRDDGGMQRSGEVFQTTSRQASAQTAIQLLYVYLQRSEWIQFLTTCSYIRRVTSELLLHVFLKKKKKHLLLVVSICACFLKLLSLFESQYFVPQFFFWFSVLGQSVYGLNLFHGNIIHNFIFCYMLLHILQYLMSLSIGFVALKEMIYIGLLGTYV